MKILKILVSFDKFGKLFNIMSGAPVHLDNEYDLVQALDTKIPRTHLLDFIIGAPVHLDNEYGLVQHYRCAPP